MAPISEEPERPEPTRATALPGSGDLGLEIEITKLRSAIIRTITELDRFSRSVSEARARVEEMSDLPRDTHRE